MGLQQFEIHLENPSRSYFAGQVVSGKVLVSLEHDIKTQGVNLKLVGKVKTKWTNKNQSLGSNSGSRISTVTDEEIYCDNTIYLLEPEPDGSGDIIISSGRYEYPFSVLLPFGVPSSFEGQYGSVRYYLEAVIKRSWKFDPSVKSIFTVNAIIDLNTYPGASTPTEIRKQKSQCCCCCKSGPVGLIFNSSKTGYVPGELFRFMAEITNLSNSPVLAVVLNIRQYTVFHANGDSRSTKKKYLLVTGSGVSPGGNILWQANDIQIPALPPTRLGGCRLISVDYTVEVEVVISGGFNLKVRVPLILGTIPFRANFMELNSAASNRSFYRFPLLSDYPDMPPPTYEEAVLYEPFIYEEEDEEPPPDYSNLNIAEGEHSRSPPPQYEANFIPRYATYGWSLLKNAISISKSSLSLRPDTASS